MCVDLDHGGVLITVPRRSAPAAPPPLTRMAAMRRRAPQPDPSPSPRGPSPPPPAPPPPPTRRAPEVRTCAREEAENTAPKQAWKQTAKDRKRASPPSTPSEGLAKRPVLSECEPSPCNVQAPEETRPSSGWPSTA